MQIVQMSFWALSHQGSLERGISYTDIKMSEIYMTIKVIKKKKKYAVFIRVVLVPTVGQERDNTLVVVQVV